MERLEVKRDKENIALALGFTEKEALEYAESQIKPYYLKKTLNVANAIDEIFNNPKTPYGLKVFGIYSLGMLTGMRAANGSFVPEGLPTPIAKKLIKEFLKQLLEEDDA